MKRILILVLLLAASGPATAAFYTTDYLKQLIDSCSALPETFEATPENFSRTKDCGLSTGYILGVYDALNIIADRSLCFPGTVQTEQVFAAVEKWMEKHPERLQESADKSVQAAIRETWSCR